MTGIFHRLFLLFLLFALPSSAFAHRLDEYLQATLVSIEPGTIRLRINLTPGVAVASNILALVDLNHDGVISTDEAAAYVEILKRDLVARVDQRVLELKPGETHFPELAELRTGDGIIQIEFSAATGSLSDGTHKFTLENRHLPKTSVYLFNAALPKAKNIKVLQQIRNENQSEGAIEFAYHPPPSPVLTIGLVVLLAAACVVLGGQRSGKSALPRA